MNRISRLPAIFSKVSVKSQTVIPREVREQLKLKPGDTLRYRMTEDGMAEVHEPAGLVPRLYPNPAANGVGRVFL